MVDDATLAFGRTRCRHLFDDGIERGRRRCHRTSQWVAAKRPKAHHPALDDFARSRLQPLVVEHEQGTVSFYHGTLPGQVKRDDLDALTRVPGASTVVLRPARLTVFRAALEDFVTARDEAEWLREDDARHLSAARSLLLPLADLAADALRAALSPEAFGQRS